jgi:hypothetical protein
MWRRFYLGNAFYLLVQNLLSSCLLSENLKAKIYKTIILPVVLYGCETWRKLGVGYLRQGVEENMWT